MKPAFQNDHVRIASSASLGAILVIGVCRWILSDALQPPWRHRYRDMMKRNAVAPSYNEALQQARTTIFLAHLEPFLPEERLLDEVVGEEARPRRSSA